MAEKLWTSHRKVWVRACLRRPPEMARAAPLMTTPQRRIEDLIRVGEKSRWLQPTGNCVRRFGQLFRS